MSAQDRTEQVLREIHILFSNSEVYDRGANKIIVDKKEVLELLSRLNICIYEMMEEYELTQQGRDKAEREVKKIGEEIILDANSKAEDVYAASVIYTDEALRRVQDIMQEATESAKAVCDKMLEELRKEKAIVRRDQSELKSHLQDLTDTDKYLNLIKECNKQIEKEKNKEKKEQEVSSFTPVKPEIKINMEYFEKTGILPEGEKEGEKDEEPDLEEVPVSAAVNVNLDAEYFKWIDDDGKDKPIDKKQEKHSLLGRILK